MRSFSNIEFSIKVLDKKCQKNEESKKYNIIDLTEKEINMITQILDLSE